MNAMHIERFTGEDFGMWKFQMIIALRARKLLNFVDGTNLRETWPNEEEWLDKDSACQFIICSSIDYKVLRKLRTCTMAAQMWRRLTTTYEQNATENVQMLQQQFFEMRMKPNTDVADHISNVELMASQLNDLGEHISEQAIITKIICTLTPSFRQFVSALSIVTL
jgi:hypothetical protein